MFPCGLKVLLEARLPHSSISLLPPVHIFGKFIVYFQYHKNREVIKNGIFTVWMTVRIDPAPFDQLSVIFLCVWPKTMIICVLIRILHNKQVIFTQLQESSIQRHKGHEIAFLRTLKMKYNVF